MPVAIVDFECEYDGELIRLQAGRDIVADRHEILRRFPQHFSPDSPPARGHAREQSSPSLTRGGGRSRDPGLPRLLHRPRYTVELSSFAYATIDGVDGLGDGRECGGGLFGTRTLEGIRIEDACGPGPDAGRQYSRMEIDWDYIKNAERAQAHFGTKSIGHWHSHPGDNAQPSESDLRCWSSSLDHEDTDVYIGVIVTEGAPYLRWHAWTVSDRDGERVCEPANVEIEERSNY